MPHLVVVSCWTFYSKHLIRIWEETRLNFHCIWMVMEITLVKWDPGSYFINVFFFSSWFKFNENFVSYSDFRKSYRNKTLHMTRQLCCCGICQFFLRSDWSTAIQIFHWILMLSKNLLVKWSPGLRCRGGKLRLAFKVKRHKNQYNDWKVGGLRGKDSDMKYNTLRPEEVDISNIFL